MNKEKRKLRAKKKTKEGNIRRIANKAASGLTSKVARLTTKEGQIKGLRNLVRSGMAPIAKTAQLLSKNSMKDMQKQVKEARKKGEDITVEDLTKNLKDEKEFMELCKDVGLDMEFFEGLAEKALVSESK